MGELDRNPAGGQAASELGAAADKPLHFHPGPVGRLRNYFLTGLILVGPLYITISLTWWFINWVDDLVRPFIPLAYRPETYLPVKVPGTGLIVALVALTTLGFDIELLGGFRVVHQPWPAVTGFFVAIAIAGMSGYVIGKLSFKVRGADGQRTTSAPIWLVFISNCRTNRRWMADRGVFTWYCSTWASQFPPTSRNTRCMSTRTTPAQWNSGYVCPKMS